MPDVTQAHLLQTHSNQRRPMLTNVDRAGATPVEINTSCLPSFLARPLSVERAAAFLEATESCGDTAARHAYEQTIATRDGKETATAAEGQEGPEGSNGDGAVRDGAGSSGGGDDNKVGEDIRGTYDVREDFYNNADGGMATSIPDFLAILADMGCSLAHAHHGKGGGMGGGEMGGEGCTRESSQQKRGFANIPVLYDRYIFTHTH